MHSRLIPILQVVTTPRSVDPFYLITHLDLTTLPLVIVHLILTPLVIITPLSVPVLTYPVTSITPWHSVMVLPLVSLTTYNLVMVTLLKQLPTAHLFLITQPPLLPLPLALLSLVVALVSVVHSLLVVIMISPAVDSSADSQLLQTVSPQQELQLIILITYPLDKLQHLAQLIYLVSLPSLTQPLPLQ